MHDPTSLDREPLCRRTIERLAAALPRDLSLVQLAREREQVRFGNRLLAALHMGRPVSAEVLVPGASLVDDPLLLAVVVAGVEGDVDAAAVGAMDDARIGSVWTAASLLFLVACRLRQEGARPSPALVRWTKWVARRADDDDSLAAVLATAELLDDPLLSTLVQAYDTPEWRQVAQETADWLVNAYTGPVLGVVPELPVAAPRAAKIGRNDKCPCGSGRKYKKCCEGKPLADQPATAESLGQLPIADLARRDPAGVDPTLRVPVAHDLIRFGELDAARRWADAVVSDDERAEVLAILAETLAALGRLDAARALADELPPSLRPLELPVRGATPARGIKALERIAAATLDERVGELALAALASPFPAVGVAVARGVLLDPDVPVDDRLEVLAALHDRRDREGWWPWDRAAVWPVDAADERPGDDVVQQHLQARRHAEAAFQRVERERARLEGELARARRQVDTAPARSEEELATAELRDELARLKVEHKRVHGERNALRRELRELAELDAVVAEEEATPAPGGAADEGDDEITAAMGVRLPLLPDGFAEVLGRVPVATARQTMQRLGELCSGRATGWRDTKRLLGFDNVWRVRIGRSYRMLYRVHEGSLEVLDLVHRQELEKKLHKLQALR